ncbi:MAG: Anaphase-promoting complex subunit 23 [Chrysothrix sp. TS-e1954]|nr:MAG: Anaphase-promoting complex subunit 23 [Chrysothrix sp. TS-e1954]
MASLEPASNAELRTNLEQSVLKCSERCLYQSAKWAAELLDALPPSDAASPADTEIDDGFGDENIPPQAAVGVLSGNDDPVEARREAAEVHKYLLAKTYFDCREYDRSAAVFLPMTLPRGDIASSSETKAHNGLNGKEREKAESRKNNTKFNVTRLSEKSLFLALYAKYLSGEKQKDEDSEMILGPSDGGATINKELVGITTILEMRFQSLEYEQRGGQGWLEYLYGIVLSKGKNSNEAKEWLLKSLALYGFNWGVFRELGILINSVDELQTIIPRVSPSIISYIWIIVIKQEHFQCQEQLFTDTKQIRSVFPTSAFLRTQKALLHYHAKDHDKAERTFSKTVTANPLRIDDLDTYSNILYVLDMAPKLAFLAQLTTATDMFRPETCCVVGNYYAMKSEHEKAVTYFRRALTLDRNFLGAWTLMGHEYMELKNTQTAIECYRRAVDVNGKDYRAWYGLGQTYEMLEMNLYALFYFEKAAQLSPLDPKMWNAVASSLAKMGRHPDAIKAYKRALSAGTYYEGGPNSSFGSKSTRSSNRPPGSLDPDVLYQLAMEYNQLGDAAETRAYLELVLAQEQPPDPDGSDDEGAVFNASMTSTGSERQREGVYVGTTATTSRARLWLAKIEMQKGGIAALRRALELGTELCEDGREVEEAKALVRECRVRMEGEG